MQNTDLTEFFDQEIDKLINELKKYIENCENPKWYDYFLGRTPHKENFTLYKSLGKLDLLISLSRYTGEKV